MLRFEQGDAAAPRGHALIYGRVSGGRERYVATYCVVLPIHFSIGKYLPPMLAGQLPIDALREGAAPVNAMPIPPMLEDVESVESLRQLAERRDDDLCDMGTVLLNDDNSRLQFAAEACAEYGETYASYLNTWPSPEEPAVHPLDDMDVDDVIASVLPERERLAELAKLIGQARYAIDSRDQRLLREVARDMHRLARPLPEKYRGEALVAAALREDATGPRLAELYLQRAYKMLDEDYMNIPPIEQEIRALLGEGDDGGAKPEAL